MGQRVRSYQYQVFSIDEEGSSLDTQCHCKRAQTETRRVLAEKSVQLKQGENVLMTNKIPDTVKLGWENWAGWPI